jgi:hypothetical protein
MLRTGRTGYSQAPSVHVVSELSRTHKLGCIFGLSCDTSGVKLHREFNLHFSNRLRVHISIETLVYTNFTHNILSSLHCGRGRYILRT